jgi:hypothetical protein
VLNNELANNVFSKPHDHAVLIVYADLLEENNHDKLAVDLRLFGLFDTKYKMSRNYNRGDGGGYFGGDGGYGDGGGGGGDGGGDGHGDGSLGFGGGG